MYNENILFIMPSSYLGVKKVDKIVEIGKVKLHYKYYDSSEIYSDGAIEDTLLELAKAGNMQEALNDSNEWAILYHCSDIRENLLEWYPFDKNAELLEIGSGCGALTGLFSRKVKSVTCIEMSERRSMINAYRNADRDNIDILLGNFEDIVIEKKYDYITLIGVWEYAGSYISGSDPYNEMLSVLKKYLKDDGHLLIAIENKMGLKYWNGSLEDHTGEKYSGLNDYITDKRKVRTFSKNEISQILNAQGFEKVKFYYPEPDYKLPDVIYSDSKMPGPGDIRNYRKDYWAPREYNFNDAIVEDQICSDGMYTYFANSFLIECGKCTSDIDFVKYSRFRKDEYKIVTTISCKKVQKRSLVDMGKEHVSDMGKAQLKGFTNLIMLEGTVEEGLFYQDEIEGITLDKLFYSKRINVESFVQLSKDIINKYFSVDEGMCVEFSVSEEYINNFGTQCPKDLKCLPTSNIDMLLSNIVLAEDGNTYVIDPEWIYEVPIPVEYTIWRAFSQLYDEYRPYLVSKISKEEYLNKIGIHDENIDVFKKMEHHFYQSHIVKDYRVNYVKPCIISGRTKIIF